ncbi:MAG: trehalase family glycosidase [bacterium]
MREYEHLQHELCKGWNTWNTRSVLSHVLLPMGYAINLGVKNYATGAYLKEALVGRHGKGDEVVRPGLHTYDGSYTELNITWQGIEFTVESATTGHDIVISVTPHSHHRKPPLLIVESGLLWNRPGRLYSVGNKLVGECPRFPIFVYATRPSVRDPYIAVQTPYLSLPLDKPIGISTGKARDLYEVRSIVARARTKAVAEMEKYEELAETATVLRNCIAWNTVYDPLHSRAITPVCRPWNIERGGYVLFCWDTYFNAYIAGLDNKELAYANAIEITREIRDLGFVPNNSQGNGRKARDRSQPPVGAITIRDIYRHHGDKWLLEETLDDLITWHKWWLKHRRVSPHGLLAWGSHPFEPVVGAEMESNQPNTLLGAVLESGLDNSPMYDDMPFDTDTHLMGLEDVGLNSLFIADTLALADIAQELGRDLEASELRTVANEFRVLLAELWDEKTGIFLNRRTDNHQSSTRLSPTNFYPLLAGVPSKRQAERMVKEHLLNPKEFAGEYMLPSIARNDPAYADQRYWRGRVWAPLNFLVYLGLKEAGQTEAVTELSTRSQALLLQEWHANSHVHENYNAITGAGCDVQDSDPYYTWGGLLGLMALIEAGHYGPPPEVEPTL